MIIHAISSTHELLRSLVNATKQVGVTSSDLNVNFMQQESLLELKASIDTESSESDPSVPISVCYGNLNSIS